MHSSHTAREEQPIDLVALLMEVWRGKWWVVAAGAIAVGGASAYAVYAREWWRADVVMVRTETTSLGGNLGQLGGLASLAGLNLGGSSSSAEEMAILRSKELKRQFVVEKQLSEPLLLGFGRSARHSSWAANIDPQEAAVRDAVQVFDEQVLAVAEDKKSGTVRVGIRWIDPAVASTWANDYVEFANAKLSSRASLEAQRNLEYLRAELETTRVPSLQQAISRVIESEIQKLLLAKSNQGIGFKVVDPAIPPIRRDWPKRRLLVMGAGAGGVFLGVLVVLGFSAMSKTFRSRRIQG